MKKVRVKTTVSFRRIIESRAASFNSLTNRKHGIHEHVTENEWFHVPSNGKKNKLYCSYIYRHDVRERAIANFALMNHRIIIQISNECLNDIFLSAEKICEWIDYMLWGLKKSITFWRNLFRPPNRLKAILSSFLFFLSPILHFAHTFHWQSMHGKPPYARCNFCGFTLRESIVCWILTSVNHSILLILFNAKDEGDLRQNFMVAWVLPHTELSNI